MHSSIHMSICICPYVLTWLFHEPRPGSPRIVYAHGHCICIQNAHVQARFFACSVGDGDATTLLFVGGRLVLFTSAMHAAGLEQGTEASRSSIPARRLDRKDEAGKPLESSWTSAVHTARRRRSATTARIGTREAGMGLTLDSRPSDCGISHDAPDFFRSNIPIPERGHLIGRSPGEPSCMVFMRNPGLWQCYRVVHALREAHYKFVCAM